MSVTREQNRVLLLVGTALAGALVLAAWWADVRGQSFLANLLVELSGAFATLVLIDLLLPRAMGLLADAQAGSAGRLRRRLEDEVALVEAAFVTGLEVASAKRDPDARFRFDLFQEALEEKWERPLSNSESEALANAIINRFHDATVRLESEKNQQ